jgi:hypothetical protein
MRKLLILLFIGLALFGVKHTKAVRDYTFALPIFSAYYDTNSAHFDTSYFYLPVTDTTIDTNMYGEIDTIIEEKYPYPAVFDQNSFEEMQDTGTAYLTFDRWAMEDWAFSFFIADSSVGEETDSVNLHVQYQFPGAPGWTVLYTLATDADASANILTYYPLDLYDNWKLYRNARIRVVVESESVSVEGWLVGRQMLYHENVDPGE